MDYQSSQNKISEKSKQESHKNLINQQSFQLECKKSENEKEQQNCYDLNNESENMKNKNYYYQDQHNLSGLLSQSNVSQIFNKSNDQINDIGDHNSDTLEEDNRNYSSDENKSIQRRFNSNCIQSSRKQSRIDQSQQDQKNITLFRRSTSSSKTIKQESMVMQKSGDYNIECAGVVKRRMLFEVGQASDERKQIQKQGLDEEKENEFTFTFENDTQTEQTKRKTQTSQKIDNSSKIDKYTNEFSLDSSNRMLESDQFNDFNNDQVVETSRRKISRNNRRFSDACQQSNNKNRNQCRQRTLNDGSPQTNLIKQNSGDDIESLTPSRSSNRSNTYNRNNVFEEGNVEQYSQRRKSKFLINQKLKLSMIAQQGGETLSPTKQADRSPYLNQQPTSSLQDLKSNNNLSSEPSTPVQLVSPIFYINDKGLTGADLQWRFVGIMKRVKKFSKCMIDHIYYKNFNNVNQFHIKAIGDISYFFLSDFDMNLTNLKKKIRIIEPSDNIALIWNFLLMISIAISIFLIPLKTSFFLQFQKLSFENIVLEIFPKSIFIIDIFINFFIAYYEKGVLVIEISKIWSNYVKFRLFLNSITTLSLVITFDNYQLIQWICMVRIFQLPKLIGMIDEHFQLQQRFNTQYELTKLILLIVSMAHFVGCGFHFTAQWDIQNGNNQTWLNFFSFANDDVQSRYLNSIYFAFITMITVGYGDITPISHKEKIYVIVITVISCGLFGYSMNTIGIQQLILFLTQIIIKPHQSNTTKVLFQLFQDYHLLKMINKKYCFKCYKLKRILGIEMNINTQFIDKIGGIFQEISKRESDYKYVYLLKEKQFNLQNQFKRQQKFDINIYLRNRQISKKVQLQILKTMEYKNVSKANKHKRGEEILLSLSQIVQTEFKKEFFGKILSNYKLFNLNFSQEARDQFCVFMKELIVQPGDCIFSQNSQNENIYFLFNGEVHIIQDINNERRVIGVAKTGDVLGNQSFFTYHSEEVGAISSGISQLVYCNRNDFLSVLKQYPKDYENFCRLRDNLIIYNRYYDQICFSCHRFGHYVLKCPFYDKRRAPLLSIFRYNRNILQKREKMDRSCIKKFNTLSKNKFVRKVLREIRWQYANEVQGDLHDIESQDEQEIMNSNDFYFYLSVPQFRYADNQLVLTDEDENDISPEYFQEYNIEQIDKIVDDASYQEPSLLSNENNNNQNCNIKNNSFPQGADKSINQYNAQEVVVECENESSGSEVESNKEIVSKSKNNRIDIENSKCKLASTQTLSSTIQKSNKQNDEDDHSYSTYLSSQQDFLLIRAKAKELEQKLFQKTNSFGFHNKSLNQTDQQESSLHQNQQNTNNFNFLKSNSLKQNSGIQQLQSEFQDQQVQNSQSSIQQNDQLQQINRHSQGHFSSKHIPQIQQQSFKKPSLMVSLIQQKYNQVQLKRESRDNISLNSKEFKVRRPDLNVSPKQSKTSLDQAVLQMDVQNLNIDGFNDNQGQKGQDMLFSTEQFIQLDLDRQKDFKGYFPNNNLQNVLKLYQKYLHKIQIKQEKGKRGRTFRMRKNCHRITIANLFQKKDLKLKSLFYQNNQ